MERKRRTPIRLYRTRSITLGSTHTHNGAPLSFTHTIWLRQATHTRKRLGTEAPIHTQCSANWRQGDLQFITIIITIEYGRHDNQYTTQITRERNLIFEMETRDVYTKWGLHTAAKGSLSGSNGHHHRVRHVEKPPPTLSVHSNPTLRERIRAKMSFPYPQFCSRLLSAAKPAKTPSLSSFFSLHLLLSFSSLQ